MSGFLGTLMGIIMVAYSCSTIKSIMINMSVALLTMFYGLVLYILLVVGAYVCLSVCVLEDCKNNSKAVEI